MKYLIWSIEHNAWRNPARAGYTPSRAEAGRYEQCDAEDICRSSNIVRANKPDEAMVPDFDETAEALRAGMQSTMQHKH